jgi:hypothetical protein
MMPKVPVIHHAPGRLLVGALSMGLGAISCAHTLSERPNTPAVAQPEQRDIQPISQTMDVAVDDQGTVAVKQNDRKKALGQTPKSTEPVANPLDPNAPAPATVVQPTSVVQP